MKIIRHAAPLLYTLLAFFLPLLSGAQVISIPGHFESFSIAEQAQFLSDPAIDELHEARAAEASSKFQPVNEPAKDLGFIDGTVWLKFKLLQNGSDPREYIIETARPVTNLVELYITENGEQIVNHKTGDDLRFNEREVHHRKMIFRLRLKPNVIYTCYMKLRSDGEVLHLPVKLWTPEAFSRKDYIDQYILGIYYGLLLFTFLIYSFFYAALKDRSFLFYVLYVAGVFLLQFSLDGLSAQYLSPDDPWIANRTVLWSACIAFVFLMEYVKTFLKLKEHAPVMARTFRIVSLAGVLFIFFVFSDGLLYRISYPVINVLSLVGIVLVISSIISLKLRKVKVDVFFTVAFFFLTAGVTLFILNNLNIITSSFITDYGMKLGTGLEVIFLSFSMANRFREMQKAKEQAQAESLEKLQEMNRMKDQLNVQLEEQVKERTREIVQQKEVIEEKNKDILSSINYAKRIQQAILPPEAELKALFPESFVLYMPKDIVSGDFYWFGQQNGHRVVAVADCTGHGVPGAFMSMIGNSFLNQIVNEKQVVMPAEILSLLRTGIISSLNRGAGEAETKDGMDISMISINPEGTEVSFAGAHNPLYYVRNGELMEVKGDKFPIGAYTGEQKEFTRHLLKAEKGDILYLFSDGFADQFGGVSGKKFKSSRLKETLLQICSMPLQEQKEELYNIFKDWKGNLEQVDDICIIGLKV